MLSLLTPEKRVPPKHPLRIVKQMDEKRSAMTNVLQLVCGGVADGASGGAADAEQASGAGGSGVGPHSGADGGADEPQIQQRPVGLGGSNRA